MHQNKDMRSTKKHGLKVKKKLQAFSIFRKKNSSKNVAENGTWL